MLNRALPDLQGFQAPVQVNFWRAALGSGRPGGKITSVCACMTFSTLISSATISLPAAYLFPRQHRSGFSLPVAHDTPMVSNLPNASAWKTHPLPPLSGLTVDRRIGYWPKSFSLARECLDELLQKHISKHPPPRNMPPPQVKTTLPRCTTSPHPASRSTKLARSSM